MNLSLNPLSMDKQGLLCLNYVSPGPGGRMTLILVFFHKKTMMALVCRNAS